MQDIYFEKLKQLLANAYAPYSRFRVSCLILSEGGWFGGVNVENATYSPTICAERGAIASMVAAGFRTVLKVYVLTETAVREIGTPCGVCRQVISEFAAPSAPVVTYNLKGEATHHTVGGLLPFAFGKTAMGN